MDKSEQIFICSILVSFCFGLLTGYIFWFWLGVEEGIKRAKNRYEK